MSTALSVLAMIATAALVAEEPAPGPAQPQALPWFAAHQAPDGAWQGPAGEPDRTAETTARVVLAYFGAGYDHLTSSKYRNTIRKAVEWMIAHPYVDGEVVPTALQAMTLAECYAMSTDPEMRMPASAALRRLVDLQPAWGRGWPTRRGGAAIDLVATAYAVIAAKSGISAELDWHDDSDGADGLAATDKHPSGSRKPPGGLTLRRLVADAGAMVARLAPDRLPDPGFPTMLPAGPDGRTASPVADAAALLVMIYSGQVGTNGPSWTRGLAKRLIAAAPTATSADQVWFATVDGFQVDEPMSVSWMMPRLDASMARGDVATTAALALATEVFYRYPSQTPEPGKQGATTPAPHVEKGF